MAASPPKVFLFAGMPGCGKTSLARRMIDASWVEGIKPTIGLDQDLGRLCITPDGATLREDLHIMLPEYGAHIDFWEIGGKDCKNRSAPRGRPIDGLVLCYDVANRSSFQAAAHILLRHRTDRHMAYQTASVAASVDSPPPLAVVLCGTKADAADENGGHMVSTAEQLSFVSSSGINGAFVTSAKTGEGVEEALQALLLAALEGAEECEASRATQAKSSPPNEMFSLVSPRMSSQELTSMSSPPGLRPHEPSRGEVAAPVVEVIDRNGDPYSARPLSTCLDMGLYHRAVHVWLVDPRNGGLLLRRASPLAAKEPGSWGPSARGEVLCYGKDQIVREGVKGAQSAELSFDAAGRVLREQLGFEEASLKDIESWGTSANRLGGMQELVEIFVVNVRLTGVPVFKLRSDEGVEWAHFMDVFGSEGMRSNTLFHIDDAYRAIMVQKIRVRVEHAHQHGCT